MTLLAIETYLMSLMPPSTRENLKCVFRPTQGPETFQASPDDFIGTAFEFEKNIKYVKFIITLDEPKDTKNNDTCVPTEPNAFDVLMEGSRSFKRN